MPDFEENRQLISLFRPTIIYLYLMKTREMTKKVISVKVDEISLDRLDGPIDDAIEYLSNLREQVRAAHRDSPCTMSIEINPYDPDTRMYYVYIQREETDEECATRLEQEERAKKFRHDQYLRLKKEFE
jgi:hypothetical protein